MVQSVVEKRKFVNQVKYLETHLMENLKNLMKLKPRIKDEIIELLKDLTQKQKKFQSLIR